MTVEKKAVADGVVRISAGDPQREVLSTGQLVLVLSDEPVRLELTVPSGPVAVKDVLPIFQGLSSLMAERATARIEAEGKAVSCRAGCGACCRQLVPISAPEARALADLVAAMPEPRQSQVRQRFDDALTALSAAGVLDRQSQPVDGNVAELGLDYFQLRIACPFLEDEACSIHRDRPLSCREYLVASPAEHCETPSANTIDRLKLEGHPSLTLLKAEATAGWMPLVLALGFSEQAPPPERDRTGPEILRDLIGRL